MSEEEEPPSSSPDEFPSLDEFVGNFINDASLWPILFVAIASAGAFGAAMIVLAGWDHNPFAAAALLLTAGITIDVFIQARRKAKPRNVAKIIGLIWCASIGLAGLAIWTGIALPS
ncbi:MAG: hypothetical protein VCB25_07630 [Myxococcota bacterium]